MAETTRTAGLAGRYAGAFYDLARERNAADTVERDLKSLERAINSSVDLRRLIKSPVFSREDQWKAMEAILARMNVSDLTRRFVGVVTANRRLFALPAIIAAYFAAVAKARGEATATVESAVALSRGQAEALKASLKTALGDRINLVEKLEPALLGGLVVRVGSLMVDSSIRTRLNSLELAMREAS
ncbi:MAG: F0F1 ATP synthase subunit delta [Alphaproteobacteria bacterium]